MFNYTLNWDKIIKENLPLFLQKTQRLQFITALIKPLKLIKVDFDNICAYYSNKVIYNDRKIYFEKILNDTFDTTNRGIYISDDSIFNANYLYRKSELKPPKYLYRLWNSSISYVIGQYAVENNNVYRALANNTNHLPSTHPADWLYIAPIGYLKRKIEYTGFRGFIVNIPIALTYDDKQMQAIINYYRLAGVLYRIIKY
jgi:hypothetical protein